MNKNIYNLARQVGMALRRKKLFLTTAESCTGGLLATTITDIPGSSTYFDCGFITYSNQSKHTLLSVKNSSLKKHGAVSENVAKEMAKGALKLSNADLAIAITGIAGPSGATKNKPIGTVCFAFAYPKKPIKTTTVYFQGNRKSIKTKAVKFALSNLLETIKL